MTNAVSTVSQLADHAAAQSDRWLFLATLIVGLLIMLAMARWFIADRDRLVASLGKNHDELVTLVARVSDVVSTNTSALNRVSEEIRYCSHNRRDPLA